jgi:hypothetical protein
MRVMFLRVEGLLSFFFSFYDIHLINIHFGVWDFPKL